MGWGRTFKNKLCNDQFTNWEILNGRVNLVDFGKMLSLFLIHQTVDYTLIYVLIILWYYYVSISTSLWVLYKIFAKMFESPGKFFAVKGHSNASTWINIVLLIFSFQFGLISFLFIQLLINLSKKTNILNKQDASGSSILGSNCPMKIELKE